MSICQTNKVIKRANQSYINFTAIMVRPRITRGSICSQKPVDPLSIFLEGNHVEYFRKRQDEIMKYETFRTFWGERGRRFVGGGGRRYFLLCESPFNFA